MLTIYKASAGSGKTFRLVSEYLKQILLNEYNYKNILAVTFTNKATAEMKERIVSQLYTMAINPEQSSYIEIISEEIKMGKQEIQARAKEALRNILHDYNRFSINTIDKFTQRIIKSFNRELGLTPGYTLELDNDILLYEATDRLILNSGTDKELLKWLTQLGEERIRNNQSFNIRKEIINLGQELFREKYQDYFIGKNQEMYTRQNLKEYKNQLQKIVSIFENELKEKGLKALKSIESAGLDISDFSYGKSGVVGAFLKVSEKNYDFGSRILNAAGDQEKWVKKTHKRKDEILNLISNGLLPFLNEILEYKEKHFVNYNTAKLILSNLYSLGLLSDLQKEIDILRHEKGILPISDSNLLLKRIINGSDTPFIYEKTGNIFNYYMLDEFQDTSGMQWENFKPLIENSLAEGNNNLAVGDAKQSIYRWRNSDWKILAQKIENQFNKLQLTTKNLTTNWRSNGNIIEFNNQVFPVLINQASDNFASKEELNETPRIFSEIYSDVFQEVGKKETKNSGFAQVSFLQNNDNYSFANQSLDLLLEQVKTLKDNNFSGKDIAILVRRNSEGSEIIRYFLDASEKKENKNYNFEIISNESLFLNSSKAVNFVTQVIAHLVNSEDKLTKANILNEYKVYLFPELKKKGKDIVFKTFDDKGQASFNFASNKTDQQYSLSNTFEKEFENIFEPLIQTLRTQILNASIDEAITFICDTFNLFELEEDLPYLQGLIDQSSQIKTNISNDLSNFLVWWDEKGQRLSVNVNDDTDAIRLLTIHKAKGLEFKAVLIPFFNWKLSWNQPPTLWCEPNSEPFNLLPLVPVKAGKLMKDSIFNYNYLDEVLNTYVDNLNLIYVAFTRAVSVLYINSDRKSETGQLLQNTLDEVSASEKWDCLNSDEKTVFTFGETENNLSDKKDIKTKIVLENYSFFEFNSRLKLRTDAGDFFTESGLTDKNLGKLLHEIMAEIKTSNDVENACLKALKLQEINSDEFKIILRWIGELLENPDVKEWFSGEYKIFTERNLLSNKGIKRPDRIMIKNNKAIIVDYKLSHALPDIYNRQVTNYAHELKATGLDMVEGYLWYLEPNKVEKVCSV